MDIMNVVTFIVVASLLVMSPGPNGVLIAKTVPLSGRNAGFANVWGFVAAFYIHGTLSIFGVSVILVQSAQAFLIFKVLGAGYLCWIGIQSLLAVWRGGQRLQPLSVSKEAKRPSTHQAFVEGFLTNALNPKVSMFYLAAFPQFLSIGDSAYSAYFLVSAHAFINVVWFSAMILLLSRLQGLASSSNFIKWLKSITGVVFIGFAAKLAFFKP